MRAGRLTWPVLVVLLGTASTLLYGVSDFFGGAAARTQPALRVTFAALGMAAVLDLPALAIGGTTWSWPAVVAGAIGGLLGSVGTWLFYAALARGPVGVVAPAVALITALLPTLWGIAHGEPIGPLTGLALVAVVVAGVLLAVEREAHLRPDRTTVLLILGAGLPYGAYIVVIGASPADSGAVPLEADLVVGSLLLLAVLLARRGRTTEPVPAPDRRTVALVVAAGITQAASGVLLVFALHLPALAIVGALSALYPVGTVVLGFAVLREPVRPFQVAGMVLAVAGVALLSLSHP